MPRTPNYRGSGYPDDGEGGIIIIFFLAISVFLLVVAFKPDKKDVNKSEKCVVIDNKRFCEKKVSESK